MLVWQVWSLIAAYFGRTVWIHDFGNELARYAVAVDLRLAMMLPECSVFPRHRIVLYEEQLGFAKSKQTVDGAGCGDDCGQK